MGMSAEPPQKGPTESPPGGERLHRGSGGLPGRGAAQTEAVPRRARHVSRGGQAGCPGQWRP